MTQEALARVWIDWRKVSRMSNPEGWAYRTALNQAKSHFRRRAVERRVRQHLGGVQAAEETDVAAAVAVRQAVAVLPHRQRAAVVLRYYADLSVADAAQVMGCAPGTVQALTHQAIVNLRGRGGLGDEEVVGGR